MPIEGSQHVRPISRTSGPTRLVTAVPELVHERRGRSLLTFTTSAAAVHVTYARRTGPRWHGSARTTRLSVVEWWDWLDGLTPRGGRVYVVAPIASDLLTTGGFWELVESGRYRLREREVVSKPRTKKRLFHHRSWVGRLILRGEPDIIHCRGVHGSILFTSVGNWCKIPLAELCTLNGVDPSGESYTDAMTGEESEPAGRQAEAIAKHMRAMIGAWIGADNGPWRETAAQLAQSLWRRRFYSVKVTRHKDVRGAVLEDQACHGGRASVWYYGDVGDRATLTQSAQDQPPLGRWSIPDTEAHRLDIRSAHATLLRDRKFPIRLLSIRTDIGPDDLGGFVRHCGCIARVELDTDRPEYPYRGPDRTRFPTGRFWTTLAGPELRRACQEGAVTQVGDVARYELGYPLRDVALHLLAERAHAQELGDVAGAVLAKVLINALPGKFAQRSDRWVIAPDVEPEHWWGEWLVSEGPGAAPKRYRSLCGLVHRKERGSAGGRLLAALFAYLTSYMRVWMRDVREQIGAGNVLSQDTDGLWVTDQGLEAAEQRGMIGKGKPGDLILQESCGFARWLDARHYYHAGQWVLSGIKGGFTGGDKLIFRERVVTNPARGVPSEHPTALRTHVRRVDLRGIVPDSPVDRETGWAVPHVVGPDRPEPWHVHERRLDQLDDD